jgi:hypothetical protein
MGKMEDKNFDDYSGTSLDDISSDLSSIESNTSTIIKEIGDLKVGFWALFFVGLIIFFLSTGDIKFSIPKEYPIKGKTKIVSEGTKSYLIIYNEDFVGSATYTPSNSIVHFYIKNKSDYPLWFDGAKFFMWDKKETGYGLQVIGFENHAFDNQSLILNPTESIEFTAKTSYVLSFEKTDGFSIAIEKGPKIRFGYHRLGWWDHLRWLIAEQIRKGE